jgi:GrpB-like predicted nucleotidyltransferase (UPF0157 family)
MSQLTPIASSVLIPDPSHPPVDISLVPYTSEWARDFEREKQRLVDAHANYQGDKDGYVLKGEDITHIGSTSIPGALAKPYIDLLVNRYIRHILEIFEKHGYRAYGRHDLGNALDNRYLFKPCQGESSACKGFFLHLGRNHDMSKFAERLQSDASLVELYNEAKRRIVVDHPRISFSDYTMLKTAFIESVMRAEDTFWSSGGSSGTPAPLYEVIHFITSTASGHVPSMVPLPFAPNEVYYIGSSDMYDMGFSQYFTPLGLALILAIEPRLSALWDWYRPTCFSEEPLQALASPTSESSRRERLERFVPVVRRLRQHGCTKAAFASWTSGNSPIIDAANAGGAEFGGIAPDRRLEPGGEGYFSRWEALKHENLKMVKSWYAELFGQPLDAINSKVKTNFELLFGCRGFLLGSAIYLSELRSFGPSSAALFHDVVCIARVLDMLLLQHHLATFIKEGVTDDIVCSLSAENLRSMGLGLGDAVRFMTAVQKELASSQDKSPLLKTVDVSAVRTLASSKFFAAHEAAPDVVKKQHELFAAIDGFITGMCRHFGVPIAAADDLFQRLQSESFENPQELLWQIQVAATRVWTSTQKLRGKGVDDTLNVEFCSLINRALRDDIADVMPHLVIIVHAINALCIVRRESSSLKFPPNAESHRGGALPLQHHSFFAVGKKYRVPMYLATSFKEDKAYEFWYKTRSSVLFNIYVVFPPYLSSSLRHSGTVRFIQSKFRCTGSSTLTRVASTRCGTGART